MNRNAVIPVEALDRQCLDVLAVLQRLARTLEPAPPPRDDPGEAFHYDYERYVERPYRAAKAKARRRNARRRAA